MKLFIHHDQTLDNQVRADLGIGQPLVSCAFILKSPLGFCCLFFLKNLYMYMCASKWSFTVNMFVETLMRDMIRYVNVSSH